MKPTPSRTKAQEVEKCRQEQKRCADYIQNNPDGVDRHGAEMGMADFFAEEIIILADDVQ